MSYKHKVKELLNDEQKFLQMKEYVKLIELKNKVMNLTGFNRNLLWKEGIYESLVCFLDTDLNGQILDIGAGAGFPSIPLLIANPNMQLTIIEAQAKRVQFLKEVACTLKLGVELIHDRAENIKERTFDLITARAVAPLFKMMEISHHLGANHATFYFIKGPNVAQEIEDAQRIIHKLQIHSIEIIKKSVATKKINIVKYWKINTTPDSLPQNEFKLKNSTNL